MVKRAVYFLSSFCIVFCVSASLPNGRKTLAHRQFESAKTAFNHQEYFLAEGLANLARSNSPGSAAPWLLIGHCFYLQGQDPAALYHYSRALALDPRVGPLPPFVERLRREGASPLAPALGAGELAALRQKIGQMIMVSVPGTRLSGQKKMMLNAGWIGGVILFNQNVRSKKQVSRYIRQLQANAPTPLFVAVDQEGGAVRRFREGEGFQRLPSLAALGRTRNADLAYRFGLLSGKQLKAVGANLNLAPVVDLDHGVTGSIITKYHRSLGSDPRMVSEMAQEIVKGMRSQNIIATAKHFPTMSVAAANPHDGVAVTDVPLSELESRDLVPYRDLIRNHALDAVMLSHVVYRDIDPYFPASLSPEMIQDLLRRKLGYQGLVISDDLRMGAIKDRYPIEVSVVQAVNAGVDVLLVTDNYERRVMDALVSAVQAGRVSPQTIDEAFQRIVEIKAKYGILTSRQAKKLAGGLGKTEIRRAAAPPASPNAGPRLLQMAQKPVEPRR